MTGVQTCALPISTNSPITYGEALTNVQAMELLRLHNTKDIFENITQTIEFLKEQNIYNNTKIIIASDHGSHGLSAAIEFISKIATDPPKNATENFKSFPSLLMIKDFDTIQNKMIADNRFLSLADLPSIIEHSLDISTTNKDYSKELPPQRVFNTPNILFHIDLIQELKQAGTLEFIKIHSASPYKESFFTVPIEDITNIPSFEIVE